MVRKKVTRKVTKRTAAPARSGVAPQGRRFDNAQKQHALVLVASGMRRVEVAATIGTTTESLRRWVTEATTAGTMPAPPVAKKAPAPLARQQASRPVREKSPYAPADPAQGLSDPEVAAILEWKKKHPSMGPAQLRAQLKRFMGWRLSIKAIARVLRGHGYALVHTKARPVGPEPVRFEAPRRNALWQADFCEVRVGDERLHALLLLDDYSRFIVGHALTDSPSSVVVTATFRAAMARHGKPEAVRTDRGGAFVAFTKDGDFGRVLEAELVDHIVGRSYSPRGGGKVESAIGTLKRELWECFHFEDRAEAERRLSAWVDDYTLRLSARDRALLEGLVERERQELEELGVEVSLSSVMRKLIRAAAKASAVDVAGVEAAAPVAPPAKPVPTRASTDVSQDQVRALLRRKTAERRGLGAELARKLGVERAQVSRFKAGKEPFPAAKLAALLELLA